MICKDFLIIFQPIFLKLHDIIYAEERRKGHNNEFTKRKGNAGYRNLKRTGYGYVDDHW